MSIHSEQHHTFPKNKGKIQGAFSQDSSKFLVEFDVFIFLMHLTPLRILHAWKVAYLWSSFQVKIGIFKEEIENLVNLI